MADPHFSNPADDDLPRTFRREKEARARTAAANSQSQAYGSPTQSNAQDRPPGEGPAVTVTALDIPFFRLMAFFMKAVLAAIPALVLLGLVLVGMGKLAQILFPWLIKMTILFTFQ
jgi:hypothetical protein